MESELEFIKKTIEAAHTLEMVFGEAKTKKISQKAITGLSGLYIQTGIRKSWLKNFSRSLRTCTTGVWPLLMMVLGERG